jgi:hypothetical protein
MFEIGSRIVFKYTGLEAEILEDHQDGSYTVWLINDEEEGIAFDDDIVLAKDFSGVQQSEQQKELPQKAAKKSTGPSTADLFFSKEEQHARMLQALQPSTNKYIKCKHTTPTTRETIFEVQQIIDTAPQGLGCYLAFHQTAADHYTIYLVNDTPVSFSFKFKLYLNQQIEHGFNKMIPASTYFAIGEFWQGQFNDAPKIEFVCPAFHFNKQFKLKYKKFLGNRGAVPLMGIDTYRYLLFSKLEGAKSTTSIKDYTLQERSTALQARTNFRPDLMDIASFEPELDLHAEKLVEDTSEFTPSELFDLQMQALETFITQAAALEIKEVFIIHGVGKGKLRARVEQYLRYHGDVKMYTNEFHEKYGFGATRVVFK